MALFGQYMALLNIRGLLTRIHAARRLFAVIPQNMVLLRQNMALLQQYKRALLEHTRSFDSYP